MLAMTWFPHCLNCSHFRLSSSNHGVIDIPDIMLDSIDEPALFTDFHHHVIRDPMGLLRLLALTGNAVAVTVTQNSVVHRLLFDELHDMMASERAGEELETLQILQVEQNHVKQCLPKTNAAIGVERLRLLQANSVFLGLS